MNLDAHTRTHSFLTTHSHTHAHTHTLIYLLTNTSIHRLSRPLEMHILITETPDKYRYLDRNIGGCTSTSAQKLINRFLENSSTHGWGRFVREMSCVNKKYESISTAMGLVSAHTAEHEGEEAIISQSSELKRFTSPVPSKTLLLPSVLLLCSQLHPKHSYSHQFFFSALNSIQKPASFPNST